MTTRIKLRRDTAANWTLNNPILAAGEPGYETDTTKTKIGDGTTHWANLTYVDKGVVAREVIGYFALHGAVPNTANNDWWFESVETDPAGNAYYTGGNIDWNSYDGSNYPGNVHVVKVDVNGEVQWQKELAWADGYEGLGTSAVYNTVSNKLVVVAQMYKNYQAGFYNGGAAVITLDSGTGAIVGNPIMIRDDVTIDGSSTGDVSPSDITLDANGSPIVVGHKNGSGIPYPLTTSSVGEIGSIFVDTAVFAGRNPLAYNEWYVTGTNITSQQFITSINFYENKMATGLVTSGTNATFAVQWRIDTTGQPQFPNNTARFGASIYQAGSGYALNDTLFLDPNQYGGSTSATITVTEVGGGGEIQNFTFTGTFNTSTIKLTVDGSGDFTTEGNWTAVNYSSEAFIWTQNWARTLGGSDFDKVNAVARDSEGNIYLACKTYDITTPAPWGYGYTRGFLAKLDSNGNKLWTKQYSAVDWFNDNDGVTGVAVDSNDNVVISESQVITKLNSAGTVIWQKIIGKDDPMDMWNTCVDIDSNDNIYIAGEYDSAWNNTTDDDFLIIKLSSAGQVLWRRDCGTIADEDTNWNNGYQILAVTDDRVHIAGSSYQSNDDVGFAASLPADGSGSQTGHIGSFFYHDQNEFTVNASTSTVSTVSGLLFTATQVSVTNQTNITSTASTTTNSVTKLRTGDVDGRLENLYSISFEDGSVQTSAYVKGLARAQDGDFVDNTNNFYPNLEHAGKMMRWVAPAWNNSVDIYVPHNDDVAFPIGTQMHFVKEQGIRAFMFWPWADIGDTNDMVIIPSSPADAKLGDMYDSGEGWSVHHPTWDHVPAHVTLTKIDTNRWLLECSSPTQIMDWSW